MVQARPQGPGNYFYHHAVRPDDEGITTLKHMARSPIQILSDLRWYLVNTWLWLRQRSERRATKGPLVLVDIRQNVWHRYLHILILFLRDGGYSVHIRHRFRFIGSWASNDLFRRSSFFNLVLRPDPADTYHLILTDRPIKEPHMLLTADYFDLAGVQRQGLRLPMAMADTFYVQGLHARSTADAAQERQRCLFFFGNMDRTAYDRPEPRSVFGCFTRTELLDLLRTDHSDRVFEPETLAEVENRGLRDIVLLGRQREYIPPARLLDELSRYDLFLAPSGVVMPLCHNVVEAMAAGCIPVLQYPHLMEPPLEHGVNCLAFKNANELNDILEHIPLVSAMEIIAMRKRVLAYYQDHLSPQAVIGRMNALIGTNTLLRVNAEMLSTQLFRQLQAGSKHH